MDSSRAASCQQHFYPRSPCGERRIDPREALVILPFLSTLSLRRATTKWFCNALKHLHFYPRSPCGERRYKQTAYFFLSDDFYPRSPCGERRASEGAFAGDKVFLSTLSLRRATVHYDNYNLHCVISIHALLAESDRALRQL